MSSNNKINEQWTQHSSQEKELEAMVTQTQSTSTSLVSEDTYPIFIFNIDRSFFNKTSHYFQMASFSSHMQGSHLMDRGRPQM